MQILCVVPCDNSLGEGPLWDNDRGRLYWLDIGLKRIHWLEPGRGTGFWQLEVRVSAMAIRRDKTFLCATDQGFALFDEKSSQLDIRFHPELDRRNNRPNDGHADGNGRFWIGTMDDAERQDTGALYRLDPDWTCTRVLDGLGIPNTVLCTPDGKTFYIADSKRGELYRFAVSTSGELQNRQLFARVAPEEGAPDGSALDEDGFLWNAQWGGSRIVRYAPDGTIDRTIVLPIEQPTSCAFGGRDLSTLFITSARRGLTAEALARQPLSGGVFAFSPGVRGIEPALFGG